MNFTVQSETEKHMAITEEVMSPVFTKYLIDINKTEKPFHTVLHHFTDIDGEDPHDHPWAFTTHILSGGYVEKVYVMGANNRWHSHTLYRRPGTVHNISAFHIHKIIELPEGGECWTVVIPKPYLEKQESGFWQFREQGEIYFRKWHEKEFQKV